jgi:excisionase family DNA binding protein
MPPAESHDLAASLTALLELPQQVQALTARVAELQETVGRVAAATPRALVSVAQAAERLGVSVKTLRRRIKARELAVVRVGSRVLVDLSALGPIDVGALARAARGR